tara:strand:+ start:41515 stop:42528 length:1014 start_codon:yes stop_codon:yes gene_type:complete
MGEVTNNESAAAWKLSVSAASAAVVGTEEPEESAYSSADLAGMDFSGKDMSGFDLSFADLTGANFEGTDLTGANLHQACISGAEFLMAKLNDADLSDCTGINAGFAHADLSGANLFSADLSGSSFASARLLGTDLRAAQLSTARFTDSDFTGANLTKTILRDADLSGSFVGRAHFEEADLRGASVKKMKGYQSASWIGTDIMNVDFCGAYAMRRFVADQNYLDEFRNQSPINELLYKAWWLTSDCGRSLFRWSILTAVLAVVFGLGYKLIGVPFGDQETILSPYYFSVVTLTTLGFGDILPVTASQQAFVMLEVTTGYMMLGGLISIFANKMARRAD